MLIVIRQKNAVFVKKFYSEAFTSVFNIYTKMDLLTSMVACWILN